MKNKICVVGAGRWGKNHINDLFDLGADLATPEQKKYKLTPLRITEKQVNRIEKTIDQYNKKLSSLNSFILDPFSFKA